MVPALPFNFATFTGTEIRGVATGGHLLSGQGSAGEPRRGLVGLSKKGLRYPIAPYGTQMDPATCQGVTTPVREIPPYTANRSRRASSRCVVITRTAVSTSRLTSAA